jgi:hypothetical protein
MMRTKAKAPDTVQELLAARRELAAVERGLAVAQARLHLAQLQNQVATSVNHADGRRSFAAAIEDAEQRLAELEEEQA